MPTYPDFLNKIAEDVARESNTGSSALPPNTYAMAAAAMSAARTRQPLHTHETPAKAARAHRALLTGKHPSRTDFKSDHTALHDLIAAEHAKLHALEALQDAQDDAVQNCLEHNKLHGAMRGVFAGTIVPFGTVTLDNITANAAIRPPGVVTGSFKINAVVS